jgi:hypothetical protein
MYLPGFTAEASLGKTTRTYHARYMHGGPSLSQVGLPASIVPTQLEGMGGLEDLDEAELMDELEVEEMMGGLEDLDEPELMDELEVEEMEAEEIEFEEELGVEEEV